MVIGKIYIWDKSGFMHIAAHSIGDYGESRGIFNSEEWQASSDSAEKFFEDMLGEKPQKVRHE